MDTSTLKVLLALQDQAFCGALQVFLKQYRHLKSTVRDLRASLEYSQGEIDTLKQQVTHLNKGRGKQKTDQETI